MENRVRDLEQLEERDPEDRGRRLGTVLMATLGMVGLTFAMGVVVGQAAEPQIGDKDPLDQLDRVAAAPRVDAADTAIAAQPAARVEAAELSFPKSLTEDEDRPEVLAALEAAAREEESLNAEDSTADRALSLGHAGGEDEDEGAAALDEDLRPEERVQGALPAAVAAGSSGQQLAKVAKHDHLVAAALPSEEARERAPHGSEGEYTLQVISYDSPAPAQAFASGLRTKGHEAFVTSADVPERGRYYRVRIGPFKTRAQAEKYRSKFENEEQMNTIVVKRAKDEG